MSQVPLDTASLKALVKEAVAEALEQHQVMVYRTVAESLEDIAMARAIQEGDRGDYVEREEIFSILESST